MLRVTLSLSALVRSAIPLHLRPRIYESALAAAFLLASTCPRTAVAQQTTPATASDNQPAASAPAAPAPAAAPSSQSAPAPTASDPPAQSPAQQSTEPEQPAQSPAAPAAPAASTDQQASPAPTPSAGATPSAPSPAPTATQATPTSEPAEITEDEIRSLLVNKQLFLRGGYLENDLSYNEHGVLVGHSPQGSYTLSAIQIDKVRLTKHKLELEGQRFGLHFLGALPYEDPTSAVDRVNITPKKKVVKITIDRELVIKPKKTKEKGKEEKSALKPAPPSASTPTTLSASSAPAPATPVIATPTSDQTTGGADLQAEIAAAPSAERPADAASVTATMSQAHSNKLLRDAIANVFAQGFDARMMDAMPDFWKLYYAAAAQKSDYVPGDPSVLRQSIVDKKARLLSTFEPASNQYAQDHGVAGICLYHVVIGADGKPGEIAVARPIGFGLDENAVDAIRNASFEAAIKDSKPVPVLLNLVVEFRIYSNRTGVTTSSSQAPAESSLPGPYSVQH